MAYASKLIVNLTRETIVCDEVVIADRPLRRMRGLLGRLSMPAGEGMLLHPAPSIHTAFMHFPIDVVFMDGTLRVIKIVDVLRPWRAASAHHGWAVLELAANEAKRREIEVGDQLGVVEVTDRVGAFVTKAGWKSESWGVESASGADGQPTAPANGQVAPIAGAPGGDEVLRVLLVGGDRRFRSLAAVLLTRRGCAVMLADAGANVADLAEREKAEVVVFDAGVALTGAARAAAQVQALDREVGIVIVAEEAERRFSAMPILEKWGSFDQLHRAIEDARPGRIRRAHDAAGR